MIQNMLAHSEPLSFGHLRKAYVAIPVLTVS